MDFSFVIIYQESLYMLKKDEKNEKKSKSKSKNSFKKLLSPLWKYPQTIRVKNNGTFLKLALIFLKFPPPYPQDNVEGSKTFAVIFNIVLGEKGLKI